MPQVFIATSNGQRDEYSEAEAHQLWNEGHLPNGTFCWQEGMADWVPAPVFFRNAQTIQRPAPNDPSAPFGAEKSVPPTHVPIPKPVGQPETNEEPPVEVVTSSPWERPSTYLVLLTLVAAVLILLVMLTT